MSSLAKESSTAYMPDFGGSEIMEEIYQVKMAELKSIGAQQFKQNIKNKLVRVVEQIVNELYMELSTEIAPGPAQKLTSEFQLFSWFASTREQLGIPTTGKPLKKQPHYFIKALINPEIGLFKYGDKYYFHNKHEEFGEVKWYQTLFFMHYWEERETGYSAAIAAKRKDYTDVWTNRKMMCVYSRQAGFTPLVRGKVIDFDYGYEADKVQGKPAYRYVKKEEKGTYTDIFGYRLQDFQVEFQDMLNRNSQWHNMDMIELNNILIETLILFHELIHVVTNTAHQIENVRNQVTAGDEGYQDTELEVFPAMPRDYPVEEFVTEKDGDWPDFDQAKDYMKAIDDFDRKEYQRIGETIWPMFSDGSGHGVEFCNMYSLFAGMRGQTTLCSVAFEPRRRRIAQQKKKPGGIARPKESDGSQKKPRALGGSKAKKKRAEPKKDGDTTMWTLPTKGSIPSFGKPSELLVKLKF